MMFFRKPVVAFAITGTRWSDRGPSGHEIDQRGGRRHDVICCSIYKGFH
jgi:hypothetical protein